MVVFYNDFALGWTISFVDLAGRSESARPLVDCTFWMDVIALRVPDGLTLLFILLHRDHTRCAINHTTNQP